MFGKEDKLFERRRDIKEGIIKDNDNENDYHYPLRYNSKEKEVENIIKEKEDENIIKEDELLLDKYDNFICEYHICLGINNKLKKELEIKENILIEVLNKKEKENKSLQRYVEALNDLIQEGIDI